LHLIKVKVSRKSLHCLDLSATARRVNDIYDIAYKTKRTALGALGIGISRTHYVLLLTVSYYYRRIMVISRLSLPLETLEIWGGEH